MKKSFPVKWRVIHGAQRIEEEGIAAPPREEAIVAGVRHPRLLDRRDWRTRDDNLAVIADSGGLRTFDVAQRCGLRSIRERRELNSVRNIGDGIAVCVDHELVQRLRRKGAGVVGVWGIEGGETDVRR